MRNTDVVLLLLWILRVAHIALIFFLFALTSLFALWQSLRFILICAGGSILSAAFLKPRLTPDYLLSETLDFSSPDIWEMQAAEMPVTRFFMKRELWETWASVCGWFCVIFGYYVFFERDTELSQWGLSVWWTTWTAPFVLALIPLWFLAKDELHDNNNRYFLVTLLFAEGACVLSGIFILILRPFLPAPAAVLLAVPVIFAGMGIIYTKLLHALADAHAKQDFKSTRIKYDFLKEARQGGVDITRLI